MDNEREFRFTKQDFDLLRRLVNEQTGISLSDHKQEMLYSRLSRRLRALNLNNFNSYYHLLKEKEQGGEELVHFINAVTTNLTAFFREPHHFNFLVQHLFPQLIEEKHDSKRVRIWSAGCASGEEPYSIAMVAKECFPLDWDVKILATDLDSSMIERGQQGVYDIEKLNGLSEERLHRWFRKGKGVQLGKAHISPELQQLVVFKQLNLMHPWPLQGPLDIIFCRNVVIYFDKATQRILFDRFANLLKLNGCLFVGHSENLFQLTTRFQLLQQTIYKKVV